MIEVCEQAKTKQQMLEQSIEQYKEVFIKARREFDKIVTVSFISFSSIGEQFQPNLTS